MCIIKYRFAGRVIKCRARVGEEADHFVKVLKNLGIELVSVELVLCDV